MPHLPQFWLSLCVSVQPLPQQLSVPVHAGPPLQAPTHLPAWQVCPPPHARPHLPQFELSVCVLEQPFEQHCSPLVHTGPPLQEAASTHFPPRQVCCAPHTFPQTPQFCVSLSGSVHPLEQHSWPLAQTGPPLQLICPWQNPPMHFCPAPQDKPQPPQFAGSDEKTTQAFPQQLCPAPHPFPPLHTGRHWPPEQAESGGHAFPQTPQLLALLFRSTQPVAQQLCPDAQGPQFP
jgi:hypothetical protein